MSRVAPFDLVNCRLEGVSLIEASAGTGKTWNICGLYLRLLLERELEARQILVVTFTNAATAELRDRIRRRLVDMRDFLVGSKPTDGDDLLSRLVEAIDKKQGFNKEAMIRRLELALQTFDEAAIFTIHGFCQRVLADTPFAAGRAFAQEMLPDDNDLLMEAAHDFWRRNVAGSALGADLAAYLLHRRDSPEKFASLLKRRLAKPLARNEWPDESATTGVYAALADAYAAAQTGWRADRERIIEHLITALPQLNANSYNETSISAAIEDGNRLFTSDNPFFLGDKQSKASLLRASVLRNRTKKHGVTPRHDFFDRMETLCEAHETASAQLEIARLQLIRRMLDDCAASVKRRKQELRVQSFDDLLSNVFDALREGPDSRLAQTLRERYPVALVDEFQDTDPLQHSIFATIYGRDLAPLFLVGDPKQAIYSFRNADLHAYLKARKGATALYGIAENQRATEPLLAAINALFSANECAFVLEGLEYQPSTLGQKPRKAFADSAVGRASLQVWWLPKDIDGAAISKNDARRLAPRSTATEIARLLRDAAAGETTVDGQPLRAGDIAVLVRTHAQGRAIREALARLGIGSVELSQASVFHSQDAEDVERVLTAMLFPSRRPWLFAALATEMMGCDAATIETLSHDEERQLEHVQRFASYREAWHQHGVGYAFRQFLSGENLITQMLRRNDGERRMTNLFHLSELLHQAERTHPSPDALLRWFQAQRRDGGDESAQLRLESDQNLVQIMTIHKAKGLEFPIVFCPFLWDGSSRRRNNAEGVEYHDEHGETVVDFRPGIAKDTRISALIRHEAMAEDLRLAYVALTRAVHRCYLVAGCYTSGRGGVGESTRSPLNWLAAGKGIAPEDWPKTPLSADGIASAWQTLAARSDGCLSLAPFPPHDDRPFRPAGDESSDLVCRPLPKYLAAGWRTGSFSSLLRGAVHDNAASDHDAQAGATTAAAPVAPLPADDILLFPRGAHAGDCLHKAFELCDFSDPAGWEMAIAQALAAHPQQAGNNDVLGAMMANMMGNVLQTVLPCGTALKNIVAGKRLSELEFTLPLSPLTANAINALLHELDYPAPRLSFRDLEGYLKGFIDLVFEHDGRFYILDWKSNHLGFDQTDYGPDQVAAAMAENGYHLQYLLYAVALDRFLRHRIPDYQYERLFGGVLYLFVRGVRPSWRNPDGTPSGVFFHRPPTETLRRLAALFGPLPEVSR